MRGMGQELLQSLTAEGTDMGRIESQPLLQLSQDDGPSLGVLLFLASAPWQEAEAIRVSLGRANPLLFLSLPRELINSYLSL